MDVTVQKLRQDLTNYCVSRIRHSLQESVLQISASSLKSEFTTYYKDILKKNEKSLTSEERKLLKKEFKEYVDAVIKKYEQDKKDSAAAEAKLYEADSKYDLDPLFINEKAYVAGKKLKVFSDYTATNSTYSMADMVATISIKVGNEVINSTLGELQTIDYSIHQEKTPVRVLGNINAKDWVFGPRTIAGSLVFAVFNKHWLMNLYDELKEKAGMKNWHFISDEIPPFNITMTFANEYGFDSRMVLYGVRLVNEGQVMSTNDIYIENTYQFVANDIELLDSLRAYEQEVSRHKRGAEVKDVGDDGYDPVRQGLIAEENKKKEKEERKKNFSEAEFEFPDEALDEMGKKTALNALAQAKKTWLAECGENDKELKNKIKAAYKTQKKRIEEYFKAKEKAKKEEEKNNNKTDDKTEENE